MLQNLLVSSGEKISGEVRNQLPEKFTNPFSYIPHKLCREAASYVQEYLLQQPQWQTELSEGKMFGVLVAETSQGELGYLAAFSGNLQGRNNFEFFVPPVYDLLNPDEFFKVGEREISALNREIALLESSEQMCAVVERIGQLQREYECEIFQLKETYRIGKEKREDLRRQFAADGVVMGEEILQRMNKESQFQKAEIKRAEKRFKEAVSPLQGELDSLKGKLEELKRLRKEKSAALQEEIFRKFTFLNALGEQKDLLDIFREFYREEIERSGKDILPPGGAGECAAPKLLQYAYLHGLRPVAMGEFWWGASPVGEIRRHGEFYPSCKGKCAPILGFMLQGLPVDSAGVHASYGSFSSSGSTGSSSSAVKLEILFEDQFLLAVNKPSGILSVPGKYSCTRSSSVPVLGDRVTYKTLDIQNNEYFSECDFLNGVSVPELLGKSGTGFRAENSQRGTEFFVVHRLDMHTSGVLLVAKNEEVYKELQRQFAAREVRKKYVAVLDGCAANGQFWENGEFAATEVNSGDGVVWESATKGIINLPLAADYVHRPAQIVDFENGKESVTRFEITGVADGKTYINFYPVTGRTHQLRVHSAHPRGLNTPIEGDLLYGKPAQRLMLHAESVQFKHPVTGEVIQITAPLPFGFEL